MAKDFSQAEPAPLYSQSQTETSVSAPALNLSGLRRVFGPKALDTDQPFPAVTPDLVARAILVSKALEHAASHGNFKGAGDLVRIEGAYNKIIKESIELIKADPKAVKEAKAILETSPKTEAEHERRLRLDFSLAGEGRSSTISKFFLTRSNLADEYIWKNKKDPGLAPLLGGT